MELRVLEYFLAVAREQNITRAAESLHLTQPTLSRQLKDLEDEFGKKLFERGKRKITLTEEGIYLRKRAQEIIDLARRTENEMKGSEDKITGELFIGAGETDSIRHIAKVIAEIQKDYPEVRFNIVSGDTGDLLDRLDKGLFDFCLLLGDIDQSKYEHLDLPFRDSWGVILLNDSELTLKKAIEPEDLWDKPLIISRQALEMGSFKNWFKKPLSELNVVATYNLINNAALMASEGIGNVLTLDNLINTEGTNLKFIPLNPEYTVGMSIVWKKHQIQSKLAQKFIESLTDYINKST